MTVSGRRTEIEQVFVVDFSSRQFAGQYLDVVSTGRFPLLPYPCAEVYRDRQVIASTNVRTCASKATRPRGVSARRRGSWNVSATDIPAGKVTTIFRTGVDDVECRELGPQPDAPACTKNEATGLGWVFVDDALAAVP